MQPQEMNEIQREEKQRLERLYKERSSLVSLKAKLAKEFGTLEKVLLGERNKNTRNLMIISGALASFSFLVFEGTESSFSRQSMAIADVGLLFVIIFAWVEMHRDLDKSLNLLSGEMEKNKNFATKGENIYNEAIDRKISEGEKNNQLSEYYREMDRSFIRPQPERPKRMNYFHDLLSMLFVVSVVLLIFPFLIIILSN